MKFPVKINEVIIYNSHEDYKNIYNLSDEVWKVLRIPHIASDPKAAKEQRYLEEIEKYPDVAEFKINLLHHYMKHQNESERVRWLMELKNNHPNHYFTKMELATHYFKKDDLEKAIEILGGGDLLLKNFIEGRTKYIKPEFLEYMGFTIKIHVLIGEQDKAMAKYKNMLYIDKDHAATKRVTNSLERVITHNISLN